MLHHVLPLNAPKAFYLTITVRLLEPRHLAEDYPITTFFENKRFSSVYWKWTNKIQGSTRQLLKTLKPFELT